MFVDVKIKFNIFKKETVINSNIQMKIEQDIKLDFSDVLIRPKRSTLESRKDIILEREFKFPHSTQKWNGVPIIASNMDTVGTIDMYNKLKEFNMLTCFHKFLNINEYPEGDEDDTNENEKKQITCTAIDLKQKLKAYFPELLLNSQDSDFLYNYLKNNGTSVRKYLKKMHSND